MAGRFRQLSADRVGDGCNVVEEPRHSSFPLLWMARDSVESSSTLKISPTSPSSLHHYSLGPLLKLSNWQRVGVGGSICKETDLFCSSSRRCFSWSFAAGKSSRPLDMIVKLHLCVSCKCDVGSVCVCTVHVFSYCCDPLTTIGARVHSPTMAYSTLGSR